ncbi:lipopolysaccharide biosynthesis protein [Nocardioides sp. CER19]|uniref:lipopolysaccharide biosynthesis protein n=1 Tax=Nocardioides sp. CER19 TaxID=3038538 RepID=UPI00244BBF72|nr:lipopolysaccharide biosynthesis protein [Nocardioides sp. CER19]MDH2414183.1 lipopolysaccharide biosynthesis protein [Nocardioides sp. CER19]
MAGPSRRTTFVGGLWNTAAMVVPMLSALLLSVVIARRLGPAELGAQSVVAYTGGLVGSLVVMAATHCTTQVMGAAYGADDVRRLATLRRLSGVVHVSGGVLAGLLLVGVGSARDHTLAWVFIGLVTFLDALGWSSGSRLIARSGWSEVSRLRLVSQIAASLLGVLAVLLGGGVAAVFGVQVLTSAWLTTSLHRRERREWRAWAGRVLPSAKVALRPLARLWGLFVLSAALVQIVDKRIELLFLDAFRSRQEVAVYAVAFSLVTVAVTIPGALLGAALPAIAAASTADGVTSLHGHLRRAERVAVLFGFLLCAALATVGPPLILVFWGEGLHGAASLMPLMALSVLLVPLPTLLQTFWTGIGRLGPVLLANGLGAVADLGTALALVPPLGVTGAALANVVAQSVACAAIVVWSRRHGAAVGASPGDLLRFAGVAALSGGAAAAAAYALGDVSQVLALVGAAVAFVVVLAVVGLLAGLVPGEDADWIADIVPHPVRPALAVVGGQRWARASRQATAPGRAVRPAHHRHPRSR